MQFCVGKVAIFLCYVPVEQTKSPMVNWLYLLTRLAISPHLARISFVRGSTGCGIMAQLAGNVGSPRSAWEESQGRAPQRLVRQHTAFKFKLCAFTQLCITFLGQLYVAESTEVQYYNLNTN